MSTVAHNGNSPVAPISSRIARKVWREVSRPVRRLSRRIQQGPPQTEPSGGRRHNFVTAPSPGMDPMLATMESEAIPFLQQLVRRSRNFPGPIIEVGTLLGVTTTHMALAKAPEQKIITVDIYCWNPWYCPAEIHEAMTAQVLHYLVATGHVDRVKMDKDEFYRTYDGPPPSLVFLDAMHDYENTKRDIEWAQRVGARIISGHDYCDRHPGVIQIVEELGGPRELCESVWVL